MIRGFDMTPMALDYRDILQRSFIVATRQENLFVLFFGAAVVLLGSIFSAFLLAGPLGVGYAHTCWKMVQGQRAELDDIFWRGFDRFVPALTAGFFLGLATFLLCYLLIVPGLFAILFSATVYSAIALDREQVTGFKAIIKVKDLFLANPAPIAIMWVVAAIIGGLLTLTIIGAIVSFAFFFLVSVMIYMHYFARDADPRLIHA